MKTTSLSLLVGVAAASSPGDYIASAFYGSSSAPAGYGSSSDGAAQSSSAPAGYPSVSASGSVPGVYPSGSYAPTGYSASSASASGPECTSTYTSTCVETSTLIYRSTTSFSEYTVTHTLTGCPSASSGGAIYPSGSAPAGYPSGSAPAGYPSGTAPAPSGGYPAESGSADVIVTVTKTNTKTVCPCEITPAAGGPTRTPGEVYVTQFTTEYETTCPGEGEIATFTYGDWTSLYTKQSLTTTTETITATVTEPDYPASSGPGGYPTGTVPAQPSNTCWNACFEQAGSPSEEELCGNSKVSNCICDTCSPAEDKQYKAWLEAYCAASSSTAAVSGSASSTAGGYPSASASSTAGAYPSGPSGSLSGSLPPYPSGSGAPSGYPSGTGASSSSFLPTGSSSSAYPTSTSDCVPCEGQPGNDPDKWCGYTIHDNWYEVTPKTCRTVEYHWNLENVTVSPDGVERMGLVINGQMPGPVIEANWGDEIIVHLTNALPISGFNGTSLHFHGIRQNGTNEMDGVSSITQCPVAPGHSMTYKWTASSYGSSWWHSHYALQTYEGMFGPMIIHGPAAAEYDDEQFVALQDWNHIPVDTLYGPSEVVTSPSSGPQTLDTGLINGLNVWENSGKRFEMTVQSGKSYRLRLLNAAIQSTFVFYVDQHELEVIAMDFVPINPYTTNMVVINIGQRYDVILKANQPSGDYWMRSDNQQPCGNLTNSNDIKAIVHYADGPNAEPTSQPYGYAPTCLDEPLDKLVPIVPWDAGAESQTISETTAIGPYPGTNLFKWTLSGTTFYAEWDNPTLKSIYEDNTVPDTSGNLAIQIPNLHEWVYIIIQTPIPLPHPIHLHGHDFLILAQGLGQYDSSVALNLKNPPRRDVAVMPADPTQGQPGYLVLAYYTSNPGVWLLHCHIGWHNAMGFALQIIENLEGIADTVKYGGQIEDTCSAWTEYANAYNVVTSDSGV